MGYLPCNGYVPCQPDHLSKKDLEDRMKEIFHFLFIFIISETKTLLFSHRLSDTAITNKNYELYFDRP